ncbi:MAG: sulfatase, partial [Verrucomicrobiales bacterium]|nr:sulfatase [Verrucomicrobiales bacterium]
RTPAFDRVAREGLLFTRAYTPTAKCAPSRACLLTGRNPWQLRAAANHVPYFPPEFKTWAEALGEHGWFVGHTQKGWGPGVATNALGRPRLMTGRAFDRRKATPPTSGIGGNDYAANFEDFLDAAPEGRPWCFWYGAIEPHRGYEFGSGVAKGGKRLVDIDRVPAYWPDNATVRHDLLDYAFEVEHFDRHLERMLALLERRGLLDNTLVVVTSDHGMPFPRVKGNTYEAANHVPLAIRWPKGIRKPGRVIDAFVSFIDIAPTVVEIAGLRWEDTGMAPSPGKSLADVFAATEAGPASPTRDRVLLGRERTDIGRPDDQGFPIRAIVKEGRFYLTNFEPTRWPAGNPETGYLDCDGGATKTFVLEAHRKNPADPYWAFCFGKRPAEEYYDLTEDPDAVRNLAEVPKHAPALSTLRAELFAALRDQEDPRMRGEGALFDAYSYANPDHRDFHARYLRGEKMRTDWVNSSDFEPLPK